MFTARALRFIPKAWNVSDGDDIMGYVFLIISVLSGIIKGYYGKKTSEYIAEYEDAMLANIIRMTACAVIGFFITAAQGGIYALKIDMQTLMLSALSGLTTSVFLVSWLMCVKKGAYVMVDVFLMLSVIVPLAGSKIMYGENVSPLQCAGLVLLVIAAFIMCSYSNSIKTKMSAPSVFLLIICGLGCGLTDFLQKIFVKTGNNISPAAFNFYIYVFAAAFMILFYTILSSGSAGGKSGLNLKKIYGYMAVMAVCLFLTSFFQTRAAEYLPSAQLYPMVKGLDLILASIMSVIFFNEKLTPKCATGIIISIFALTAVNI